MNENKCCVRGELCELIFFNRFVLKHIDQHLAVRIPQFRNCQICMGLLMLNQA